MSRLVRRRTSTVVATTLLALAVPAAAHAATYTVKGGDGICGGGDLACGGLADAATAAVAGDVFNVAPGTYTAANFTTNVEIKGDLGFTVDGTLQFSGGGVSKLSKVAVATGAGNAPAIYVSGGGGLELSDSIVVSRDGFGIFITSGLGNKIVRTGVVTGGRRRARSRSRPGRTTATSTSPSSPRSSPAAAPASAPITQQQRGRGARRPAPPATSTSRCATSPRSGRRTASTSTRATRARCSCRPATGNITATVTDSIAFHNRVRELHRHAVAADRSARNIATLTRTRTMESGDPLTLFLDPAKGNFRLRSDATAAIGQGGFTPGESTTDIDGEDRSSAPTDLGADEYNNAAPVAKIALATSTPRTTQPVTFDGRGSADRDGQATIAEYRWRFSDGTAVTTTQPFVQHAFAAEGDAAAGLIVVDNKGAASTEVAVVFKLINGVAPAVGIVKPKSKQTFRTFTTTTKTVTRNGKKVKRKTRKRTKIIIAGLSKPAAGTTSRILLTLQKTNSTKSKTKCRLLRRAQGAAVPLLLAAEAHHGAAHQGQHDRRMDLRRADDASAVARLAGRCRPTASTRPAPSATRPMPRPRR